MYNTVFIGLKPCRNFAGGEFVVMLLFDLKFVSPIVSRDDRLFYFLVVKFSVQIAGINHWS